MTKMRPETRNPKPGEQIQDGQMTVTVYSLIREEKFAEVSTLHPEP